jgi:hypothetical protein
MILWLKRLMQPRPKSEAEIRAAMLAAQAKDYAAKLEVARLKRDLRRWGGWEA